MWTQHARKPGVCRKPKTWRLSAIVIAAWVLLTGLYAGLGYLDNLGQRIAPVDSAYYYMYLPSLFEDGDIDFKDEVTQTMGAERAAATVTATGMTDNHWPVGPALLWAPAYLLAKAASWIAGLPDHGFAPHYQGAVYVVGALYGLAGLLLLAGSLRRFMEPWPAGIACLFVMCCTQLAYYLWPLTAMAHALSFFSVALFFWVWLRTGCGVWSVLAAALVFMVRWQDILYALPLAVEGLTQAGPAFRRGVRGVGRWIARMSGLAAVFLLACLPQWVVWKILYGDFITLPPHSQKIDLLRLHPMQTLFSLADGLLSWHPAIVIGLAGLALLWKRDRSLAWKVWLAVGAQLIFISSLQWSSGDSFGLRFFTSGLVYAALGLGLLLQALWERRAIRNALCAVLFVCAVWNQLLVYQYMYRLVPHAGALTAKHYFSDKFHLGAVRRAEEAYLQARERFMRGDMRGFYALAQRSQSLDPDEEKRVLALAMGALYNQDLAQARTAFSRLHESNPGIELYNHALAAFALARGVDARRYVDALPEKQSQAMLQRQRDGLPLLDDAFLQDVLQRLSDLQT